MARTILVKRKSYKPKRFRLKTLLALMEADLPGIPVWETPVTDTCWPLHLGCIHDYEPVTKRGS